MNEFTWVRFEAHHGGGHMGHTIEYKICPYRLGEKSLQWLLEDWSEQFNNVKSTVEIIPYPPHSIVKEMIDEHLSNLKYSAEILTYCYKLLADKNHDTITE